MASSCAFTVGVFHCICARLSAKAAELRALVETGVPFDGWLTWEAFLACKGREAGYPFCEVTARPTYASEGVADEDEPARNVGGLRVGGPNDGADHCWLFAEVVLLGDGSRPHGGWRQVDSAADKLLRLGWKKSAALVIVVVVGKEDVPTGGEAGNRLPLTDPFVIPLDGGGKVTLTAFDVKRDPADTLTVTRH